MVPIAWKFWTLFRSRQRREYRRHKLAVRPRRWLPRVESLEDRLTPATAGFLSVAPGVIGGSVYVDTNNNGLLDAGETTVPGVTITLSGTTAQGKAVSASASTDASGHYVFTQVAPGTYSLTRGLVNNFSEGQPTAGNLGGSVATGAISSISLAEGQAAENYNFAVRGLASGQVSLRDFLSTFTNGSVLPSPGSGSKAADGSVEPAAAATPGTSLLSGSVLSAGAGIQGAQVTLYGLDSTGRTVTQNITTGATGAYVFSQLQAGTYNLNVTSLPAGFRAGQPSVGTVDGQVFLNNQIVNVQLATGTNGSNYNFTEIAVPGPSVTGGVSIAASLADDTAGPGGTTSDGITVDPSVQGTIASTAALTGFTAQLDSATAAFNILSSLQPGQKFFINQALLNQIAGGTLAAGAHTLHLVATDVQGHSGATDLGFVFQNTAPAIPTLHLDSASDPGSTGTTTNSTVTLQGQTTANVQVALIQNGAVLGTTTAGGSGAFSFANVSLSAGANDFTAQATDNAGNTSQLRTFFVKETGVVAVPTGPVDETLTNSSASDKFVDLSSPTMFTDAAFTNSIIQFNTSAGPVNVQLFDTQAPQNVANFIDYIQNSSFTNDIFHRLVNGFVIQGGGFTFQAATASAAANIATVATGPTVPNEFDNTNRPNVAGTIAMAKGSDPNSATSQFFFNLADNTQILNASNAGGFTAFGKVLSGADMRVLNTLATAKVTDESKFNSALGTIPLNNYTGTNFPKDTTAANYDLVNNVQILRQTEQLTFSIATAPNASVATATITFGQLDLHPVGQGTTTVVVKATDKSGQSANITFNVNVGPVLLTNPGNQTNLEADNVHLQVSAKDTTGATLTYSATGLPSGLSITPSSGLISGTIANNAHTGSPYTVNVTANDGTSAATQTFTWTVNPVVTIDHVANQSNKEGDIVNVQVTGHDAKGGILTYSASNLPGGLSINAVTGLISGTVSTGDSAGSPFSASVTAGDGTFTNSQNFTWTVTP